MRIWPFRRSRAADDAGLLLVAVQKASRIPAMFGDGRIPDTLEGRFEAVALHSGLAMIRLRAESGAGPIAQIFTDRLFRYFDAGLREAAVGDLTVPKRMRKLAGDFYGRLEVYSRAIENADHAGLAAALVRNVRVDDEFAAKLATHMMASARIQAGGPVAGLFEPGGWPPFPE